MKHPSRKQMAATNTRHGQKGLAREQKLGLVTLIVLAGFVGSVLFHYIMSSMQPGYPFNTFLFRPDDRFMDYYNGLAYVKDGHGAGMVGTSGVAYFVWRFLYLISFKNAYVSFLIYTGAAAAYVLAYNLGNALKRGFPKIPAITLAQDLFILTFLSYPVLFTLDRGNFEAIAFVFLSLFVYFFCSNRMVLAAVFLAGAAALKIYPAIFFILYLSEKRYRGALIFLVMLLAVSAWSYNSMHGIGFHLSGFLSTIKASGDPNNSYNALYVIGDEGAAFCSSAFGALKAALYLQNPLVPPSRLLALYRTYYWVSLLTAALVVLYVIFVEKELWKKIAILTVSMIFFPFVTGDYRLLHLYIPMWLFVNAAERRRGDTFYSTLFALLLIPKAYYPIKGDVTISVILNPLIIAFFLLTLVTVGLYNLSMAGLKETVREHLAAAREVFRFKKAALTNAKGAK